MVPKGWEVKKLDDIAKIKSGSTPLRAKQDLYFSEDGTPWVKTLDLNNSEIITTDERITELALKETSCSILPTNTVLVAMYGGFNQIGRTGLLTEPAAINQALSGLILDLETVNPKYVLDYLNGNVGQWKKFAASSRKDPNITRQDVCSFEILLPPLPEQQKIATILATWDKAISTTERLIENSTHQKKALMQQLLTGKKRLLDDEGKRFEGEWKEVKLGDLKLDISDGNYSAKYPKQADFLDTGVPFLRANNLDKGTISDTDMRFISPKQHSEITKGHLKKGDILLSTRGELGNVALVPDRHIGSNINAQLVRINTKDKLSGKFLFQLFDYLRVTGKFESLSTGTALKQLPIGKLKILEFNLPLLIEEQQKIATVLTNANKEIELLEQQLADLQQEKKALMQVLLTGKKRVVVDKNV